MNGSDGRIDFTTLSMVATLLSFTSVQFDRTASAVNPFVVVSRLVARLKKMKLKLEFANLAKCLDNFALLARIHIRCRKR
jgi:hypothetical protein